MSPPSTAAARVVGLAGSLRAASLNRKLLEAAGAELPSDATMTVWDGLAALPAFDADLEAGPEHPAVAELRAVIRSADAVLIATPEYNGSLPGHLKTALDWASRPRGSAVLEAKPVATLSAGPSPRGAARAHVDLRRILAVIGADIRGEPIVVPTARARPPGEPFADAQLRQSIRLALGALLAPAGAPTRRAA